MRRTTIALSAVALTATLGACSQGGSGSQPDQSQSGGSAPTPVSSVSSLVSNSGKAASQQQTFTLTLQIDGGDSPIGKTMGMGNMTCQIDAAKQMSSCSGKQMQTITTPQAAYIKGQMANMFGATPPSRG